MSIQNLLYADNSALVSEPLDDLQEIITSFQSFKRFQPED